MKNSKFGKINLKDIAKGGIVFAGTAALATVAQSIDSGHIPDAAQITLAVKFSLFSFVSYMFKNAFTNSEGQLGKAE